MAVWPGATPRTLLSATTGKGAALSTTQPWGFSVLTRSCAHGQPAPPHPNIQNPHLAQGVPPLWCQHHLGACSMANLRVSKHIPVSALATHLRGYSAGVHTVTCKIPTSKLPVSDSVLGLSAFPTLSCCSALSPCLPFPILPITRPVSVKISWSLNYSTSHMQSILPQHQSCDGHHYPPPHDPSEEMEVAPDSSQLSTPSSQSVNPVTSAP